MTRPVCGWEVEWVELDDMRETCQRPQGHPGHHHDGLWWFDNDGHRQPRDEQDDE